MIKYDWLKNTINSVLENYIYPRCLDTSNSISTSQHGTIVQYFYPFSQTISSVAIYVKNTIGNYQCTVNVYYNDSVIASKSNFTIGWNTISVNKGDIVSKKKSSIVVYANVDSNNYVVFGATTIDTYLLSSNIDSKRLSFKVIGNTLLYNIYPKAIVSEVDLPIVVGDIIARPRVRYPYLTREIVEEIVTLRYSIYSMYSDEIDLIAKMIERCMYKESSNISGVYLISPSAVGDITRVRENILSRQISFNIRMFIRNSD